MLIIIFLINLSQVFDLVATCADDGAHEWLRDEDLDFQHGSRIPPLDVLNRHREGTTENWWCVRMKAVWVITVRPTHIFYFLQTLFEHSEAVVMFTDYCQHTTRYNNHSG